MYGKIIITKDGIVINTKHYGYVLFYTDAPQISAGVVFVTSPEMPAGEMGKAEGNWLVGKVEK